MDDAYLAAGLKSGVTRWSRGYAPFKAEILGFRLYLRQWLQALLHAVFVSLVVSKIFLDVLDQLIIVPLFNVLV
jgi:hypothetical protein